MWLLIDIIDISLVSIAKYKHSKYIESKKRMLICKQWLFYMNRFTNPLLWSHRSTHITIITFFNSIASWYTATIAQSMAFESRHHFIVQGAWKRRKLSIQACQLSTRKRKVGYKGDKKIQWLLVVVGSAIKRRYPFRLIPHLPPKRLTASKIKLDKKEMNQITLYL